MLEEVYVYFDMPPPAFGIQLVYDNPDKPEFAAVVHDGDAVLMPSGYHPNVAAPGHSINFIWMMAAHTRGRGPPVRRRQRPARLRSRFRARQRAESSRFGHEPCVKMACRFVSTGSLRSSRARGPESARRSRARSPRPAPTSLATATSTCRPTPPREIGKLGRRAAVLAGDVRDARDRRGAGRRRRSASSARSTSWSTTRARSGARPPSTSPTTTGPRCWT